MNKNGISSISSSPPLRHILKGSEVLSMIPAGDAFLMRMETEGSLPRKIFLGRQLYWRAKNEVKDWIQLRMEEK